MTTETTPPPESIEIMGSDSSRSRTATRGNLTFQVRPVEGNYDSGLILYHNSGWLNITSKSARDLGKWLIAWARVREAEFKPSGFRLKHRESDEVRELADGEAFVILGDSFFIRGADQTQLSEALSLMDWEMEPIIAARV